MQCNETKRREGRTLGGRETGPGNTDKKGGQNIGGRSKRAKQGEQEEGAEHWKTLSSQIKPDGVEKNGRQGTGGHSGRITLLLCLGKLVEQDIKFPEIVECSSIDKAVHVA